jgi:hypothetical protein
MTQLGFDDLLAQTESDNEIHAIRRKYPGLPSSWDDAIPHYFKLLDRCNAAFLVADLDAIKRVYDEAETMAIMLNGRTHGLTARDGAGTRLAEKTRAPPGTIPLWGQQGEFVIEAAGISVRMDTDGIFGIATRYVFMPGLGAHAVDWDKPFISETGFRSFIGYSADLEPGVTIDAFARALIEHHVANALKGRLVRIQDEYADRALKRTVIDSMGEA